MVVKTRKAAARKEPATPKDAPTEQVEAPRVRRGKAEAAMRIELATAKTYITPGPKRETYYGNKVYTLPTSKAMELLEVVDERDVPLFRVWTPRVPKKAKETAGINDAAGGEAKEDGEIDTAKGVTRLPRGMRTAGRRGVAVG